MFSAKNLFIGCAVVCILLVAARPSFAQSTDPDSVSVRELLASAKTLYDDGNTVKALETSRQANQRSLARFGADNTLTALTGMYIAKGYREMDREGEALPYIEQSLEVYHRAGDVFWEANCHNNALLCKRKMLRFAEAHEHARKAYALLLPDSVKQAYLIGIVRMNEASVYNAEKRFGEALSMLQQTRNTIEPSKDPIQRGYLHFHLGSAYFGLNDFTRSSEHYLAAWSCLQGKLRASHPYFTDLYERIGRCSQRNGDPETGLKFLLTARDRYLEMGANNPDYAAFLQYFGQFYFIEGRCDEAMQQFELCLETKENIYGKNSFRLLNTLYALGETGVAIHQYDRAEQCLRRALYMLSDSFEENGQVIFPYVGQLAAVQLARNFPTECIALCDSAFALCGFNPQQPESVFPREHVRALCHTYARAHANVYEASGNVHFLETAERYFSLASQLLFLEVGEISVESSREVFYDKDHEVLDDWLQASMELYRHTGNPKHAEAAFGIVCRERALLLSDAMRRSGALKYAGVPDSLLQNERNLRATIAEAEKARFSNENLMLDPTDSKALFLNDALSEARQKHDDLMCRIKREHPMYFQESKLQREVSIKLLQKDALDPNQALLVYSTTATAIYAFVLTRDTFVVRVLPPAPDVAIFNQSLTDYFTNPDPDDASYDVHLQQYTARAQTMYISLVEPLETLLPEQLIIVPGGNLCYLPFEALLSGEPVEVGNWKTYPFWNRQKSLRYALSPDLFLQKKSVADQKKHKPWLGMAPFATDTVSEIWTTRTAPDQSFDPLPFSGKEVRTIAAQMHGDVWLGSASSAERFQKEASDYRILHFATHSLADDRQGDYSYLVVSPGGEKMPARDLYQYELPADMVVLSSCEAGSGKSINGEGIIGLVRAFTYAGAQSVVASQWVTGDQSSAELMIAFYNFLGQGMPRDKALQQARLYLLNNHPDQGHPFYWAGFRMYGNR